jgi:hypothetical protein
MAIARGRVDYPDLRKMRKKRKVRFSYMQQTVTGGVVVKTGRRKRPMYTMHTSVFSVLSEASTHCGNVNRVVS